MCVLIVLFCCYYRSSGIQASCVFISDTIRVFVDRLKRAKTRSTPRFITTRGNLDAEFFFFFIFILVLMTLGRVEMTEI